MLRKNLLSQVWLAVILTLLISSSVQAYELFGYKWPTRETTMSVGIAGSSPTGGTWSSGMSQAISEWNSRVTGFELIPGPVVAPCGTLPDTPYDFKNGSGFTATVCGTEFGSSNLAVTLTFVYTASGEAFDSDIMFNAAVPWNIFSGPMTTTAFDFRRVAVHELGHTLGLWHEDIQPAIMSTFVGSIEVPQADDIAAVNFLYPDVALDPLIVSLEEASQGQVASGLTNIRGWAVATAGIDRVEIWLDGSYLVDVPSGGSRGDVGNSFPEYPGSENSGFSMAMPWGLLTQGAHTMTARAYDNNGGFEDSTHSFTVTTFDNPFIKPPATVVIDASAGAIISDAGSAVTFARITADGKNYQVKLKWNTQTQQFNINQVISIP